MFLIIKNLGKGMEIVVVVDLKIGMFVVEIDCVWIDLLFVL